MNEAFRANTAKLKRTLQDNFRQLGKEALCSYLSAASDDRRVATIRNATDETAEIIGHFAFVLLSEIAIDLDFDE